VDRCVKAAHNLTLLFTLLRIQVTLRIALISELRTKQQIAPLQNVLELNRLFQFPARYHLSGSSRDEDRIVRA
jgi:hypothetical protein